MSPHGEITNALTIDFEDWYQGLEIPVSEWGRFESRIVGAGERLLRILAEANVKATFFVLGAVAERHPEIVRAIAAAGHEVGTHGYSHTLIYTQTPQVFQEEMKRAVGAVEQITGQKILGHRAPFFSITKKSLWALDILGELGLRYDTSIFPVMNYRYGIEDAPRWPYEIEAGGGAMKEFPISTWRILGKNVPIAGGAYFRIFPYAITRAGFRSINRQGRPAVFYLHPWELDPDHPRIDLPRRIAATHYFNLGATEGRLIRLLRDFPFAPMKEILHVH
ncbi:MAG TPA: XrtA system polysaccharide deacetylase [Thermoanaerobaculia bacterium]|nr:XrtA system polysaccharide deacetylase [Thermoanaerobaculia bacterium]